MSNTVGHLINGELKINSSDRSQDTFNSAIAEGTKQVSLANVATVEEAIVAA